MKNIENNQNDNILDKCQDVYINHFLVNNIKNLNTIANVMSYPRKDFLPERLKSLCSCDGVISYKPNRYLLDIVTVARMLELIHSDVILNKAVVIGSGVGYLSAIISKYFSSVISIEEDEDLIKESKNLFFHFNINNVIFQHHNINEINEKNCDYIFIEGAFEEVNPLWIQSLNINGKLIGIKRFRNISKLVEIVKLTQNNDTSIKEYEQNSVPLLYGLKTSSKFIF